jgi:hypothetical protein
MLDGAAAAKLRLKANAHKYAGEKSGRSHPSIKVTPPHAPPASTRRTTQSPARSSPSRESGRLTNSVVRLCYLFWSSVLTVHGGNFMQSVHVDCGVDIIRVFLCAVDDVITRKASPLGSPRKAPSSSISTPRSVSLKPRIAVARKGSTSLAPSIPITGHRGTHHRGSLVPTSMPTAVTRAVVADNSPRVLKISPVTRATHDTARKMPGSPRTRAASTGSRLPTRHVLISVCSFLFAARFISAWASLCFSLVLCLLGR